MTASAPRPAGLVPVHVGQRAPVPEDPADTVTSPDAAGSGWPARRERRSALIEPGIEWHKHGAEPRWLGMETSDCAAALDPGIFHSKGAAELDRFLAGVGGRHETAIVIATIGDAAEDDVPRSILSPYDASVSLPNLRGSISGRRLPAGAGVALATGLPPADRDLGLRLRNRPPEAPWWSLKLGGYGLEHGDGRPATFHAPEGQLDPILVDGLGEPVVAAWTSPGADQRWYIVPDATDWNGVVEWLIHHALPAYVPDALRRARSPHFVDPDLQTQAELLARQALADMTARHAEEKARLEGALEQATAAAEGVRYGLLYGTDRQLVDAVDAVLRDAGLLTVNLDDELGRPKSADLLASFEQRRRLIEVKSARGNASEDLVGDLHKHLTTWPKLRPQQPVDGGVLIVNHQYRLEPYQRSPQVYTRPEFVDALTVPVIGTRSLFDWWRVADWASIRDAVLGPAHQAGGGAAGSPQGSEAQRPASSTPRSPTRSRRFWRRNVPD